MCGICGYFEPDSTLTADRATVRAMTDTLTHRGPDDGGYYCGRGVALGHRRLSIIDVSGGHQPLANEDESVWIAFNGEIYNFQDLNDRYLRSGHTFQTRSDTETVVHLYEELGEECFAKLRGMFAIALWDNRRRRLVVARDRIGKKPLYYYWDGRRFVFGSEIKALWPAGGLRRDIDLEAMSDYFSYLYVPAPKTIYKHVRKLRPAHYIVVDENGLREVPYWDLRFDEDRSLGESAWSERLLSEYRESVRVRLISDVPLGAFLSGGVDSSSVVALMNGLQPPVTTCSIGFTEQAWNEADDARAFAQSLGADHHEQMVSPETVDIVDKLAWHYDEPFADSSAVPTYYVSKLARQHVTVALSGDGGDENFAGYRRYKFDIRENRMRSLLPAGMRRAVFGPLSEWYPKADWAPRVFRAKTTLQSLARSPIEGWFNTMSSVPPEMKPALLGPDVLCQLNGYDSMSVLEYHFNRAGTNDPLARVLYTDIKTYLVDDILTKVDRASMANSLEVRCPLLDHELMETAARIPSHLKLRGAVGKYILKRAVEPVVPREILDRRKWGFGVPLAKWFRNDLKQFAADRIFGDKDEYLNYGFISNCWNEHQRGARDWSSLMWTVLMFKTWQEVCEGSERNLRRMAV
jgi:asparagine synthase (glutamine-hydrolysing)